MSEKKLSSVDFVALAISTCGVGYIPLAPGTFGSAVGVALSLSLAAIFQIPAILIVTFAGIWAASRTEKVLEITDPGKVVVDEVAGQMITLLPVVLVHNRPGFRWVIISFVLFRFFDIVKPYPARRLERLHGGLGIMADDLMAGVYGAVVVFILMRVFG